MIEQTGYKYKLINRSKLSIYKAAKEQTNYP